MNYIVKMINGDRHVLNHAQYTELQEQGEVFTKNGVNIVKRSMSNAYPESEQEAVEGKEKQKLGILHDGSRVMRQFGEWVPVDGERDERGLIRTRLDPQYYPEAAKDLVPTPEEFEREYRQLGNKERLEKMLVSSDVKRLGGSGFERVGKLLGSVEPSV